MGFIGPNGAGKTTAMRILATLETPTSGDAFICGNSVIDYPDRVRRVLGFMPDAFGKYANMNVIEYLDFFARAYGFRGAARRDALERVLVFTELRKIADKPITTLSKGMSQRLGLGRTLIHDPQVLILDEPAAGLDPRARVELRELIGLLATDLKKTVLISSHILPELADLCTSIGILERGELVYQGSVSEALKRARVGTVVHVVTPDDREKARQVLEALPTVQRAELRDGMVVLELNSDTRDFSFIARAMLSSDLRIHEIKQEEVNLETAFMRLTKGVVQ